MDPTDFGPGTVTWLSGTGTVLLGAGLWLRKWLSRDATERAMDSADIAVIRRLTDLLDIERDARREAEAKADQFARERNELVISVGRLQGKVLALTSQLAMATKKHWPEKIVGASLLAMRPPHSNGQAFRIE